MSMACIQFGSKRAFDGCEDGLPAHEQANEGQAQIVDHEHVVPAISHSCIGDLLCGHHERDCERGALASVSMNRHVAKTKRHAQPPQAQKKEASSSVGGRLGSVDAGGRRNKKA